MTEISLEGQVAVVTGAGQGLGAEYARALAARGAAVVVNDLPGSTKAQDVVDQIAAAGGRGVVSLNNVAERDGARRIIDDAVEQLGGVDILVNNAGILRANLFEDLTQSEVESTIAVHLLGMFWITQPAWEVMKSNTYGRIINIASTNAFGVEGLINYSAAKAGVLGFNAGLALEAMRDNVLVNAVMPNAITEMAAQATEQAPVPRLLENTRFLEAYGAVGHCSEPARPAALVTYLASRECTVTGECFAQTGPRYSRVFLGVTDGWMSPEDTPPAAEDIAAHFDEIRSTDGYFIPKEVADDFVAVVPRLSGAAS